MKKLLLLAISIAGASYGATLTANCIPANANFVTTSVGLGNVTATCDLLQADPGFVLSSLTYHLVVSFQDTIETNGPQFVAFTSSSSGPSGMSRSGVTTTDEIIGQNIGNSNTISINVASLTGTQITVALNAAGSSTVLPDNASFTASLIATQTPTSGVPEPVSMMLFGSGMIGVAVLGRKKFARK